MAHHKDIDELPPDGEKFDITRIAKVNLVLFWLGAVALGACVVIGVASPALRAQLSYSWLFAFVYFFTLALGGLFWTMLHHATNSGWGVVVRRTMENLGALMPWLAVLALPLLIPDVRNNLWEWMGERRAMIEHAAEAGPGHLEEETSHWEHDLAAAQEQLEIVTDRVDAGVQNASPGESAYLKGVLAAEEAKVAAIASAKPTLQAVMKHSMEHDNVLLFGKGSYLNLGFWIFRLIFFFACLIAIIRILRGWSVRQDATGNPKYTLWARRWSCGFIPIFAVVMTFSVIDWLMALDYTWFSTMWGVYIFAGTACASMAVIVLVITFLRQNGYLKDVVTAEHYHCMGKLMHAFVIFWAYIAFSQFFLIWYANITEETRFYILRNTGGWNYVSMFLVACHFFVPFLFGLRQSVKRTPRMLCILAVWMLALHLVDIYWIVIPERAPSLLGNGVTIPGAFLLDVLAFVGIGCILAYLFFRTLGKDSLYPCRDPRLEESVNLVN